MLDTNVLISSSIYIAETTKVAIPLKHRFFDKAMSLIGLIRKHLGKRIGVITHTVEDESYNVLENAVLKTLEEFYPNMERKEMFKIFSIILDECYDRLRKTILIMLREPIDEEEKKKYYSKIKKMYEDFRSESENLMERILERVDKEVKPAGKKLENTARRVKIDQYRKYYEQIARLKRKFPSEKDMEILAEAAYLSRFYRDTLGGEVEFYLASFDTHFSPIVRGNIVASDVITRKIYEEFKVICNRPDEIFKAIKNKF